MCDKERFTLRQYLGITDEMANRQHKPIKEHIWEFGQVIVA